MSIHYEHILCSHNMSFTVRHIIMGCLEHSLLYAMIEFPERYPEAVVKNEIDEEEFDVYLYVNNTKKKGGGPHAKSANGEEEEQNEGNDHATQSQSNNKEDERVSYAQLSALLSLSSEKNPPVATANQNESPEAASARQSSTPMNISSRKQSNNSSNTNNNSTTTAAATKNAELSIGQTLCRKLLKTITRYCDTHNLDRQTEVAEFLNPIEKRCRMRNEKAALQQLLPAYAGYTLSLVTGNPLPLLIGAAALTGPDPMVEENSNVVGFRATGGRVGDMETAGLLDECDSD